AAARRLAGADGAQPRALPARARHPVRGAGHGTRVPGRARRLARLAAAARTAAGVAGGDARPREADGLDAGARRRELVLLLAGTEPTAGARLGAGLQPR